MSVNWNKCCLLETSEVSIMDLDESEINWIKGPLELWFSESFSERLLIFRDLTLDWTDDGKWFCKVGVEEKYFSQKGFSMENFQSLLRRANRLQSALDQQVVSLCSPLRVLPRPLRFVIVDCHSEQSPSEDLSVDSYAVVAAAAVLLSLVYLYLTGQAARGGSIPYSSGSLDFRDTYIPIILFHGAYVWIKSRDVAPKGVYRRLIKDKRGNVRVVFEPRFKPPRTNGEASQHIYVGQYETEQEAKNVYDITAKYFQGQGGRLELEDGNSLTIPPMIESDRLERRRVGAQVRSIYESFKTELRANATQPGELQVVGVEATNSGCLADTTYGAPLLVSPTHNSETGIAPCGNHGLDSHCELCNGVLGLPPGNGVEAQASRDANDSREGVATQTPMGCGSENQLDPIQILLRNQHELFSQVQELSKALQQIKVQLTQWQNHQCPHHLALQEFSNHSLPLQDEQPFQVNDQGVATSQASDDRNSDDLFSYFAYPTSYARS